MKINTRQATYLVSMKDPEVVCQEIKIILAMISPGKEFSIFTRVFNDVCSLYKGLYPGYRACNALYHDLGHTMNVLLAMVRLIHGAVISGYSFTQNHVALALSAALLHDVGYIQNKSDRSGTGAKYTATHVMRSIEFMQKYLKAKKYPAADYKKARDMILCTALDVSADKVPFKSRQIAQLSRMLSCADLIGQMADREYLEKLLFLYYEFKEARIGAYTSEADLLKKTIGFFRAIDQRLAQTLGDSGKFMTAHFLERWKIDRDLYAWYMHKNCNYLKNIIADHAHEHRSYLKRGNVVERLQALGYK
jgi:hypothetical protein